MTVRLLLGDARKVLEQLPEQSVQCVVTSPPYWGLRDYGLPPLVWGGDPECEHMWGDAVIKKSPHGDGFGNNKGIQSLTHDTSSQFCQLCGAWRGSLGLEPDPSLYVQHIIEIMREIKRVLRDDGTLWLNLGDSYAGSGKGYTKHGSVVGYKQATNAGSLQGMPHLHWSHSILKPKDLVGIPWRVAFALQADGWWLRSDIIWTKPNCMPESVKDRPTRSHEYVFLLAKSKQYYYDQDAIREPLQDRTKRRYQTGWAGNEDRDYPCGPQNHFSKYMGSDAAKCAVGRNKRTVWTVTTKPYREAHFAVFPSALIRPMILAGTSRKGCCPECGKAWVREIERHKAAITRPRPFSKPGNEGDRNDVGHIYEEHTWHTVGWRPQCDCGGGPVPCTILDPFCGSGTTAEVCIEEGRSFVGIELNPGYLELAKKRVAKAQQQMRLPL